MVDVNTLVVNIVATVIIIFVNAFTLWLTTGKILRAVPAYNKTFRYGANQAKGFNTALIVALIAGLVSFILSLIPTFSPVLVGNAMLNVVFFIVNAVVLLLLIRKFYELAWGKTAAAWLIVTVIGFIIGAVIGGILGLLIV